MKIGHINICRGLYKKIDVLEKIINDEELSVLGLSEIDLDKGDPVPVIQGFRSISDDRGRKVRVCMYVEDRIDTETLICPVDIPAVVVHTATLTVGIIYSEFTSNRKVLRETERRARLQEFLEWFGSVAKREAYVLGDANYDVGGSSGGKRMMQNWALDNDFEQVVKSPTRVVSTAAGESSTCLDIIFARGRKNKVNIFEVPCSDHAGVWVQVNRKGSKKIVKTFTKWQVTPELLRFARDNPPKVDVENIEIDESVRIVTEWLQDMESRATIKRTVTLNPRKKPWFTPQLEDLKIKYRETVGEAKKKARNAYVNEIKKAKQRYEKSIIAKNAAKGVWAVINSKKQVSGVPDLVVNGCKVQSRKELCGIFREHFKHKVERLKSKPDPGPVMKILKERYSGLKKWDISECTVEDMAKQIDTIPPKRSCGPDGISNLLLKTFKWQVVGVLTKITNKCIQEGLFPRSWRCAKVVPVYKGKGGKSCVDNYRPVGLTSVLGKLVEGLIGKQMEGWLDPLLPDAMFGFRKSRGTADAIVSLTDDIKKQRSKGKKVILLACDASCAFELCSRKLITDSLSVLGAGPKLIRWLGSYLENRTNFVQVEGITSLQWAVEVGVIQGTLLSPFLYNVVAITQSLWIPNKSSCYADDGACVVVARTEEECQRLAQETANRIAEWFKCVGLSLNSKKSELMGFGFSPQPLVVGGQTIEPKSEIKFLGYWITSDLSVNRQVQEVIRKIRYAAARIRAEGRHMGPWERRQLYAGWVNGQLCANGVAYLPLMKEKQVQALQRAANSAVRAVAGLPRWGLAPITEVRRGFKIESVEELSKKLICVEAWKRNHDRLWLTEGTQTRGRKEGNFPLPDLRGHLGSCLENLAQVAWNKLPVTIKTQCDIQKVKRLVRNWLRSGGQETHK